MMEQIHGIFRLWNSFSVWEILIFTDSLFFWSLPEWSSYSFEGEGKRRKDAKLTHKKIPFILILIKPNSSCFKFHNSRRVKLENVSLNNWASVFHQTIVLSWYFHSREINELGKTSHYVNNWKLQITKLYIQNNINYWK